MSEARAEVVVWVAAQPDVLAAADARAKLLPEELAYAGSVNGTPREQEFVAGRVLLRELLQHHAPAAAQQPLSRSAFDAPLAGDVRVSLSHAQGYVAAAMCRHGRIGIDLEALTREVGALALSRRYFDPQEAAQLEQLPADLQTDRFLTVWTLKEAWLKAEGRGIAGGLSALRVDPQTLATSGHGRQHLAIANTGSVRLAIATTADPATVVVELRDPAGPASRIVTNALQWLV